MTSILALLGFLALMFLLVHRALVACERQNSQAHKRQRVRQPQDRPIAG